MFPLPRAKIDWARIFILAGALAFLFLFLDWKPAQHDEGVNGWIIQEIISKGFYAYDPANYHGPLHFYLLFIFRLLFGDNLIALRLSAVLFSLASIYLLTEMKHYLGKFCAYGAAFLAVTSPGMIFYSRYAIHESGLLFFSLLALLGFFRMGREADKKSLWMTAAGVTGMIVTKETCVISLGCFFLALGLVRIYERLEPSTNAGAWSRPVFSRRDVLEVTGVCAFAALLLFSGFFMNWDGVTGIFRSLGEWVRTGILPSSEQKGHWKPFSYWIQLFLHYEWAAAAGFLFCLPLLGPSPRKHRLIMFFAVAQFALYSVIPYKTPWCILQIIWPFLVTTVAGLDLWVRKGGAVRTAAFAVLAVMGIAGSARSISLNFFHYADEREPYAHVQTFESIHEIEALLEQLVRDDPTKKHIVINVVKKAYWPLSWLLLDFSRDYYYTEGIPPKADAGVIFCDRERIERLEVRLGKPYFVREFRLNPAQDPSKVYFDAGIFGRYFPEGAPTFVPPPDAAEAEGGLRFRMFDNPEWQGEPVREGSAPGIGFAWDERDRPFEGGFSMDFAGEFFIPEDGKYEIFLASDDGSELKIGEEIHIDNLGRHAEEVKSKANFFKAGWHPFNLRYNDYGGGASAWLWWKRPGRGEERIPAGHFRAGS